MTKITRRIIYKRLGFWANRKGKFAKKQHLKWIKEMKRWERTH